MSEHDPFSSAWRSLWPKQGDSEAPARSQAENAAEPSPGPGTQSESQASAASVAPGGERRRRVGPPRRQSDRTPLVDPLDATIPILTQVVELPEYAGEPLPRSLDEVDWSRLATTVRERVLESLLNQPGDFIDEPMRERLPRIVERGVRGLAAELRSELEEALRDAVAQAVTEELTRLQEEIVSRAEAERSLFPATPKEQH